MSYKKQSIFVFLFGLLLLIISYFDFSFSHFCVEDCDEFIFYKAIAWPLLIISPILFFLRQEVFSAWRKFAVFGFPIMVVLLLYFFNNEPTYGLDLFGQDEEWASIILPILFLVTSLLIIGIKSWKLKYEDNKKTLS